ncbi:MOSC domain-containing protein [Coralliovum pocilloporae]|uniref:MOSC domain-containing protein n=1 Tax=Coralliovum pocilloporae TaxID=3066369 RepID=UPI003307897D
MILRPTSITGRVECLLVNRDREQDFAVDRIDEVSVTYAGFEGEAHGGLTRPSCVRVKRQYPVGTEIRNTRQISIVSQEEMASVASTIEIPGIEPEWVWANLVLSGIPDFTLVPPSSRLIFENGVSLVCDMENEPCRYPASLIEQKHPGKGMGFPKAAINKRGVTAWVEREGMLKIGETCTLHIPPQRIYEPALKKRG